jgi:hypothetical protein
MHRIKKVAVSPVFALLLLIAGACSDLPVTPSASATASGTTPLATALSAYITGPTQVAAGGIYTWYANPSGGNGIYAYKWQYQVAGGYGWTDVGTGASYTRGVAFNAVTFHLRLVVTSEGTSVTPTIQVTVTGGCDPATC